MTFNADKLSTEFRLFFQEWREPMPGPTHRGGSWVNRFVEAARESPYAIGHVDAFLWPLFALSVGMNVFMWLT